EAKAAKEKAKAEAKAAKEAEKARQKAEKEAKKHGKTLEPTPVVEEKPKKVAGAFEEEHLVPLDEFLANLPYRYTSNQWKTKYTIWIPRVSLQNGKLVMDPYAQVEPLNLSYVERATIIKDQDGQETKSAKTERFVDTNAFRLLVDGMTLPQKQVLQNPVAWAFDPMTTEAHPTLMHKGGTNIMSPSWFKLDSNGLEVSPRVNTEYVRTYREKGYQVWPLITNQFSPSFTASILKKNDTGLWATYAQQLVIYALAYGFEGYNFDFENINLSDKDRLTQFVTYLSDYLHKYNIYTSIDVTGYSTSENWSMVYDRPALAQAVDYVVLMAYDETGHSSTTAGPVASYPWVRKHTEKMVTEVPPNKLVLGIPFYTRVWTETYGRAKSKTLTIQDSRNYLKAYGNHIQWDDNLKSYTLVIPSSGLAKTDASVPVTVEHPSGSVQKIWFEDEKSLDYKLQLVNELHLAGFAAWRKGFEDTSINDLIANYPLYSPETAKATSNHAEVSKASEAAKTAEQAKNAEPVTTDKASTKVEQKLLQPKTSKAKK
ncbi:MAG: hypothetical protein HUJ85_07270, partial [Veillonella sp.]|nr:hypothetical protein [Veillonella sp.]